MNPNTLFLRLAGPMQAWGDQQSKFVIRRTGEVPTRSGVIGLLCAAMGIPRPTAAEVWLPKLSVLRMGVRIDQPGIRTWDYHTVGAGMEMRIAEGEGKTRLGPVLTRREYLCDASFLVVLQGEPLLIAALASAMSSPAWTLYLGRKCCPPSTPLLERAPGGFPDLLQALASVPWRRRYQNDPVPEAVDCLVDWLPAAGEPEAPPGALVFYDVPVTFEPPAHAPRFVTRVTLRVGADGEVQVAREPAQNPAPRPPRPTADYTNSEYRSRRAQRLKSDHGLCVLCKSPATTVQHITYRHAGGDERQEELRSLCRLCHDAVTMVEYGLGMGLDRINPEEPVWRERVLEKRRAIVGFRSLETRRRRLSAEEVE